MRDTTHSFSPLLDEAGFDEVPFSTNSYEFYELQSRLQEIERFVNSTAVSLRLMVRLAVKKAKSRQALEQVLELALDQVSLMSLAREMLADINSCLDFVAREKAHKDIASDSDLEDLLQELGGVAKTENQQH